MKLLWILFALLATFAIVNAHSPCKCAKRFHKKVARMFHNEKCKWTVTKAFYEWYESAGSPSDQAVLSGKFIEILTQYEQGLLPIVTSPTTEGWEFLYGYSGVMMMIDVEMDVTVSAQVEAYLESVGDYEDGDEIVEPTIDPSAEEIEQMIEFCLSSLSEHAKVRKLMETETWNEIVLSWHSMSKAYKWNELSKEELNIQVEMMTQLSIFNIYSTEVPTKPAAFCPEQFYSLFGWVLSSEETRMELSMVFADYDKKCPNAPKEMKYGKLVSTIAKCKRGKFSPKPEKVEGKEWIDSAILLVEQLMFSNDLTVLDLFDWEMEDLEGVAMVSCDTVTSDYQLLVELIAEECGMKGSIKYEQFHAYFITIINSGDWTIIRGQLIYFFNLVCGWTDSVSTTPIVEDTTVVLVDTTVIDMGTTEVSLEGSTIGFEVDCESIKKYFSFFGFFLKSKSARGRLNHLLKLSKESGNGKGLMSFNSVAFVDMTFASAIAIDGDELDDDSFFFEYSISFLIEFFFSADVKFKKYVSDSCEQHQQVVDECTVSVVTQSTNDIVIPDFCEELNKPEGIFVFIDLVAKFTGIFETSWYTEWLIKFKSAFPLIDIDCGCWEEFVIDFELEWIKLLIGFFKYAMCGGCTEESSTQFSVTDLMIETTEIGLKTTEESVIAETTESSEDNDGEFEFWQFFIMFCMKVEWRVKFNTFITWYLETNGFSSFEECCSGSGRNQFFTACFEYMCSVFMGVDVTYTVNASVQEEYYSYFAYECMYDISFVGTVEVIKSCKKAMSTISLPPPPSHDPFPTTCDDKNVLFTIQYMAICGFYSEDSQYISDYTAFTSYWSTVSVENNKRVVWDQLMMFIQMILQRACTGGYTVTPATSSP